MNRTIAHTTLTTIASALVLACGGVEDPDGATVDAALEAEIAASSASAITVGGELGSPVSEADLRASNVASLVQEAYGRRMPCASIARSGALVEVDFGTGCPVHGRTVSGAFSVGYTRTGTAGATFTLLLDDLSAGVRTSNGSFEMSAGAGAITADVSMAVEEGGVTTDHLFAGTMVPDASGAAFDGTARRDDGTTDRDLAFVGIYVAYGDCYPSAGHIEIDASGQPTTTVTFDAQTPSTGAVEVQVGRLPAQTVTLPACPL